MFLGLPPQANIGRRVAAQDMKEKRVFLKIDWSPEEREQLKAIREWYQRVRPTPQQLADGSKRAPRVSPDIGVHPDY